MQRTSSTRARQNSAHTSQPARPPSTTAKETNGNNHITPSEITSAPKNNENKIAKVEDTGNNDAGTRNNGRSVERGSLKREESVNSRPRPPSIATGTRNNGKASKTGTPVAATFAETTRPRSGRNANAPSIGADAPPQKRSHKKGGGIAAAAAKAAADAAKAAAGDGNNSEGAEDEEAADGEPLYCYCQKVSYGEMIGCDRDGCKREWFHLGCVGLDKPPGKNGESCVNHLTEKLLTLR